MTMRDEFEAWWQREGNGTYRRADMFLRDEDAPDEYVRSVVQNGWQIYQAAYPAGQRAERERCARICEGAQRENMRYASAMGIGYCELDGDRLAAAIRNKGE